MYTRLPAPLKEAMETLEKRVALEVRPIEIDALVGSVVELGELTGIPCDTRLLRRIRATPQQTRLSAGQRRRNLRGAFQIAPHHYRHVALLDDVVTTGATAGQLTRLLHESGIARVEVWAICRTLRHIK